MKPTIKHVAKLAGVSFKTVSRVINKEDGVVPELQERVWKAVKELNYKPNKSARVLRGAVSSIGLIYDNPNSNYIIEMQNGILSECRTKGYELVIHPCQSKSPNLIDEILEMTDRSQVGGLILTPPISEMPEVLKALQEKSIKSVSVLSGSEPPDPKVPCMFVDDRGAAYRITEYLVKLGHNEIAFLGGEQTHKSNSERFEGYRLALRDNGVELKDLFILPGEFTFESGVERTNRLLSGKQKPTAVFAGNDEIAAGVLFASRLHGCSVPEDLSIVGFEDSPFSRQTWPNLTTAQQPNRDIAHEATTLLVSLLKGRNKDLANVSKGFSPQLIVRQSTCPPRNE